MRSLNKTIQTIARAKQKRNKYIITAVFMCLLVAACVCYALIRPAVSLERPTDEISQNDVNVDDGKVAHEFKLDIIKVNATNNGSVSGSGSEQIMENVSFTLEYSLPDDAVSYDPYQPYIWYKLSDQIKIPEEGMSGHVTDAGTTSGYYKITPDGHIVIRFTNDYLQSHQDVAIGGTVQFAADVGRKEGEDGSSTDIEFGDVTVTVDGFTPAKFGLEKTGVNNEDGTVTWKITITNPNIEGENRDLQGYYLTDTRFAEAVGEITIDPQIGYNLEGDKLTINDSTTDTVTITYSTPIDGSLYFKGDNEYNKAELYDGENTTQPIKTDDSHVWVGAAISMDKSGTGDYANQTATWTITVNNSKGLDLGGFTIDDSSFTDAETDQYIISNGVLTFKEGVKAEKIEITYQSSLTSDEDYKNKATIRDPENEGSLSKDATIAQAVTFDKWANNSSVGYFNWEIQIKNNGKTSLQGYSVTDDLLSIAENLVVKTEQWSENQIFTLGTDYTIESNGKLTILRDTTESIRITYQTPVSAGDPDPSNSDKVIETNTAELYDPNETLIGSDTERKDYTTTNWLNKWYESSGIINDKENKKITIPWVVEIGQEAEAFANKTFEDIITIENDKAALSSIDLVKVYNADNTSQVLTEGVDYIVTINDNKISLEFTDSDTVKAITKMRIEYTSDTDYSGCDPETVVVTKNSATFNGNTASKDYSFKIPGEGAPYIKYDGALSSIDGIGADNVDTTNKISELEKVTIEGVEYYLLKYQVLINQNNIYTGIDQNNYVILEDTLPSGFTLNDQDEAVYAYKNNDSSKQTFVINQNWGLWYQIDKDNPQKITFHVQGWMFNSGDKSCVLYYSAKIPVATLDKMIEDNSGQVSFTNSIQDKNNGYDAVDQTQTIREGLITKDGTQDNAQGNTLPGHITYTVDFNKNGENLSSGDTVTLTDVLTSTDGDDPGALAVALESITVYAVDANGNQTALDPYSYLYNFDNSRGPIVNAKSVDGVAISSNQKYAFHFYDVIPGSTATFVVKGEANKLLNGTLRYYGEWGNTTDIRYLYPQSFDSDGTYTFTVQIPENISNNNTLYFEFYDGNNYGEITGVSADFVKTTYDNCAKLQLTVPDEQHLRIVYSYSAVRADSSTTGTSNDEINITNNISFDTGFAADSAEKDTLFVIEKSDSATSYGSTIIELKKVDIGNELLKLDATFNLYMYDAENGIWLPATACEFDNQNNANAITWGESDSDTPCDIQTISSEVIKLKLNTDNQTNVHGVLFKIVEKEAPTNYIQLTSPYYFSCIRLPSLNAIPSDVNFTSIHLVTGLGGQILAVDNAKNIEIAVDKKWSDTGHENDSVTVELYRSTVYNPNGLPSASDLVKVEEITLDNTNNWSHKWDSLINGDVTTGQAYYYYVVESKYTINGTEYVVGTGGNYTPSYSNYALNQDGSVTIINNKGLTVEKIWLDADGNETNAPNNVTVDFKLYRSTTKSTTRPADAEEVTALTGLQLNDANGWKYTFASGELQEADANGNTYYYYVEETSNLNGYTVSYTNNAATVNATISIVNKADKVDTGVVMPSTGGDGTKKFAATGVSVIALALAGYVTIRLVNKRRV